MKDGLYSSEKENPRFYGYFSVKNGKIEYIGEERGREGGIMWSDRFSKIPVEKAILKLQEWPEIFKLAQEFLGIQIETNIETSNIHNIIKRFDEVNKERITLNTQIREHYEPLLINAAKTKNKMEYDRLLSELPDCPFVMTAYRIGELNGL